MSVIALKHIAKCYCLIMKMELTMALSRVSEKLVSENSLDLGFNTNSHHETTQILPVMM